MTSSRKGTQPRCWRWSNSSPEQPQRGVGSGLVLSKRHNLAPQGHFLRGADGPFQARPEGATPMCQSLRCGPLKGPTIPYGRALTWRIGVALNGTESMTRYTRASCFR
jgi:hypothetical protein